MSAAGLTMPARRPPLDPAQVVLIPTGGNPNTGYTIMQAIAITAGAPSNEPPASVSPVLATWLAAWADSLRHDARQDLRRYIWPAGHSRGTAEQEATRQWLSRDWFVRVRTAIWLHAAGMHAETSELASSPLPYEPPISSGATRHRSDWLMRPRPAGWIEQSLAAPAGNEGARQSLGDEARAVATIAMASGASARSCETAWRTVVSVLGDPSRAQHDERWWAIADATWPTAHAAARHLLHAAAGAARLDAGRGLLRRPDGHPRTAFDAACDIVTNAAGAVAWTAVARTARPDAPIWQTTPQNAWTMANATASQATSHVREDLNRSAHQLVDQLLATTRRGGRQ